MNIIKFFKIPKKNLVLKTPISLSRFQEATAFPLKLAQIFSYFPIHLGETQEPLEFKWVYWRIGYSLLTFSLFLLELFFVILEAFKNPLNFLSIKVIVFHLGAVIQYVLFFKLTYVWPSFVKEWAKVEYHMKHYEIIGNLKSKLGYVVSIIMFIAGVEHGLVNAYKLKRCFDKEPDVIEGFKAFFIDVYEHIFNVLEYSFCLGLLIQFLNLQRTFYWNYTDVFIMLIGSALTYRLKQMSKKIKDTTNIKANDLVAWKNLRKDYTHLSELCYIVNENISSVIIICFLMDLYFVLLQLYSSLRPIDNFVEKFYFFLSFGLLLLRISCMCIFGGAVYEEWKNIRFYLNTIATSAYNPEVDRLINHVTTWELSLSGKHFFNISRGLILQIAGAIVTYELVLIQFYKNP